MALRGGGYFLGAKGWGYPGGIISLCPCMDPTPLRILLCFPKHVSHIDVCKDLKHFSPSLKGVLGRHSGFFLRKYNSLLFRIMKDMFLLMVELVEHNLPFTSLLYTDS